MAPTSIESWISHVEAAGQGSRKRSHSTTLRPSKRRRPLHAVPANSVMAPSSPVKTRGRGRGRGRHQDAEQLDTAPAHRRPARGVDTQADVDATPRPRRLRGAPPSLPPPDISTHRPPSNPSLSSMSRSSTKRSASPVKGLADLTGNAGFVHTALDDILDNGPSALGDAAFGLFSDLAAHSAGASVIPHTIRPLVESSISGRLLGLADNNFFDDERRDFEVQSEYQTIQYILRWARRFTADQDYEPAWNEQIHSRVLELALRGQESVWFRNISKADISPKDLIPKHSLGGDLQAKMVDYAIYLEQNEEMRDRTREALAHEAHQHPPTEIPWSVNHTTCPPLRQCPIAVSIETKTPSGKDSEAVAQLSVWGAAHLARLRRLVPPGTQLPTLPLILVSGMNWDLYFINVDDRTTTEYAKTKIFGAFRLGDTMSLLGVYRLLCAVRLLARWAEMKFRVWWESAVLP